LSGVTSRLCPESWLTIFGRELVGVWGKLPRCTGKPRAVGVSYLSRRTFRRISAIESRVKLGRVLRLLPRRGLLATTESDQAARDACRANSVIAALLFRAVEGGHGGGMGAGVSVVVSTITNQPPDAMLTFLDGLRLCRTSAAGDALRQLPPSSRHNDGVRIRGSMPISA
jgi:hypothetical protein